MKLSIKHFRLIVLILFVFTCTAIASVESTLAAMQSKLMNVILPLASILGFVFAGLSFVAGSPNAKQHFILAIIGAVVGFAAPSIVAFIQQMVH